MRERCCSVSPTHIPQRSCYGGVPSRYDISVKTGGLGVSGGDNFISSIPSFSEHWFSHPENGKIRIIKATSKLWRMLMKESFFNK